MSSSVSDLEPIDAAFCSYCDGSGYAWDGISKCLHCDGTGFVLKSSLSLPPLPKDSEE